MQIDTEYLRRHYASLSDAALLAINRSELVPAAQACYDEEVARRVPSRSTEPDEAAEPDLEVEAPEDEPVEGLELAEGEVPAWLEDAACACSFTANPGVHRAPDAEAARDALLEAGVPCYIESSQVEPEKRTPHPIWEFRVLVPARLHLKAASILDKEIFNPEIERDMRTHLEALTDEELRELDADALFGGLLDRIERLKQAYQDELDRRAGDQSH